MKIESPGIYEMSAETYHEDPVAAAPSLSSSIAKELLDASPVHAQWSHPRLNPSYLREDSERFDLGTAVHAWLIEGGDDTFKIIEADDWRTAAAKRDRELARLAGLTPLLAKQWERVQAMALAARAQLKRFTERPRPLENGQAERVLVWIERVGDVDVWCRSRIDWLHDDVPVIDDYKSTGISANPDLWGRTTLFSLGFDLQAAFYLRGLMVLLGLDQDEARFRFVVQENFEPYALSVVGLTPEALTLGEKKRRLAVQLWAECLTKNRWPGYPTSTVFAELPPYLEARWMERENREDDRRRPAQTVLIDDGRPIDEQLAGMGDITG